VPVATFEHVFADLGGIPANRLSDMQGLAGLLLAAANAVGLNPASGPVVKAGPRGVAAALLCHGGHVALHAVPEEGVCFADVAGLGPAHPQRGLDVIVKRLGARDVRSDTRRRGSVAPATNPEDS
jgi:S-adenosylmethionine decarboxylase